MNPTPHSSPLGQAPAFALLVCFSLLLFFAQDANFPFWLAAVISVIAAAGWMMIGTEQPSKSSLPIIVVLLFMSAAGSIFIFFEISRDPVFPTRIEAKGVIISERKWGWRRAAIVRAVGGTFPGGAKHIVLRYEGGLKPGDLIRFSGKVTPFKRGAESGGFDEFMYWKAKGAPVAVDASKTDILGHGGGIAYYRYLLTERIKERLPRLTAGYIAAAWTGERDDYLNDFHRNAGTSHLLVVSGLHVGIVAAVCMMAARPFPFRLYLTSAVVWFYVFLSGASPSSLRAALMIQFALIGRVTGQKSGAFNGVSAVAAMMLAHNPWLFHDIGWKLSVLSVLSISSVSSLDIGKEAKYITAGFSVWLITSVQSAWVFGMVPIAGLVINFFAIPIFSVLLPAASLLAIPSLVGIRAGHYAALCAESFFIAWERFSGNLTFLIPWSAGFSLPLAACALILASYIFARACGFSGSRAGCAAITNMLMASLYNLI